MLDLSPSTLTSLFYKFALFPVPVVMGSNPLCVEAGGAHFFTVPFLPKPSPSPQNTLPSSAASKVLRNLQESFLLQLGKLKHLKRSTLAWQSCSYLLARRCLPPSFLPTVFKQQEKSPAISDQKVTLTKKEQSGKSLLSLLAQHSMPVASWAFPNSSLSVEAKQCLPAAEAPVDPSPSLATIHCRRWQMPPTAAPGGPHSHEDVHQAGHAPLDAQQHPSHFLLHWIQEKWEQRDVFCQNDVQESSHTPLCFVGIYFQVQSAVHHSNIFNKISRKWDDNKTMIF